MREGSWDISVHPACFGRSCGYEFTAINVEPVAGVNPVAWLFFPQRVVTVQCGVSIPGVSKLWQERTGAALTVGI